MLILIDPSCIQLCKNDRTASKLLLGPIIIFIQYIITIIDTFHFDGYSLAYYTVILYHDRYFQSSRRETKTLKVMDSYYRHNQLKPYSSKTNQCAFFLRNK